MNLVNSQQARRVLDRIVGYKISPLLWTNIQSGLSAGRVQSVTTRLVVDREEEIRNFVPTEYWLLGADLITGDGSEFFAKFYGKNGEKLEPVEEVVVSVPDEYTGPVISKLNLRKGMMKQM